MGALPDNYPDAIHHHHNNYVDFLKFHDHDSEQHDERGRHTGDWTNGFFGPACTDDHDDGAAKHFPTDKPAPTPTHNPYGHDRGDDHDIDRAFNDD